MWGWGEILSVLIAMFLLITGILYTKEYHEKNNKNSGGGDGTILGELLYSILASSPYYILKLFLILLGIIILVCIFMSKM
ncbi:hypothetical protein [Peribacillus loiseleuriae]|uniref:hypothetical protein n=1 Tax=Peribacillus loiseleuriae TaxID=1679170 RepID=UPI003D086945